MNIESVSVTAAEIRFLDALAEADRRYPYPWTVARLRRDRLVSPDQNGATVHGIGRGLQAKGLVSRRLVPSGEHHQSQAVGYSLTVDGRKWLAAWVPGPDGVLRWSPGHGKACRCCVDNECECGGWQLIPA